MQQCGSGTREHRSATVAVVPDSGTGELRGIRGAMDIAIGPDGGHTFAFDYELG